MAVLFAIWSLVAFLLNTGGVQSVDWSATSLPDGQHVYACAGDNVTFAWHYTLKAGDMLSDVQWVYDGQSQELVAMSSRDTLLVSPTFSQRVSRVDNAGLSLSRVLVQDSGNYSVEVNVITQAGSIHTVLRRTAVLHVSDGLMTTDGNLHVTQLPDAVFDNVTNQWVMQLRCGTFTVVGTPPFYTQWTAPSGQVYNSTGFDNGDFYLNVPTPIESGTYSCAIPPSLTASVCLHGNGSAAGGHGGQATVTVASVEARLLLLEKENWDLKHKLTASQANEVQRQGTLNQLSAQMADLAYRLNASISSQNQEIQRLNSQLQQAENQLTTTVGNLTARLVKIEDVEYKRVAFHAIGLLAHTPTIHRAFTYSKVVLNQGNAYSATTGYFTAPHSGLYFFLVRTAIASDPGRVSHKLLVGSNNVDNAYTNINVGSHVADQFVLTATHHLLSGQRVSVQATPNRPYYPALSTFTGFLLSPDP